MRLAAGWDAEQRATLTAALRPALLEKNAGRNGGLGPVWRAANTYLAKAAAATKATAPKAASKPTSNKAKAAAAAAKVVAKAAARQRCAENERAELGRLAPPLLRKLLRLGADFGKLKLKERGQLLRWLGSTRFPTASKRPKGAEADEAERDWRALVAARQVGGGAAEEEEAERGEPAAVDDAAVRALLHGLGEPAGEEEEEASGVAGRRKRARNGEAAAPGAGAATKRARRVARRGDGFYQARRPRATPHLLPPPICRIYPPPSVRPCLASALGLPPLRSRCVVTARAGRG